MEEVLKVRREFGRELSWEVLCRFLTVVVGLAMVCMVVETGGGRYRAAYRERQSTGARVCAGMSFGDVMRGDEALRETGFLSLGETGVLSFGALADKAAEMEPGYVAAPGEAYRDVRKPLFKNPGAKSAGADGDGISVMVRGAGFEESLGKGRADEMSVGMPEGITDRIPAGIPGGDPSVVPGRVPGRIIGEPPAGITIEDPGKVPGGIIDENPGKVPGGITIEDPGKVPGGVIDENPGGVPGGAADEDPGKVPGGTISGAAGEAPEATPGVIPGETPGELPGETPDVAPAGMVAVTAYGNGGLPEAAEMSVEADSFAVEALETPKKLGKMFSGWYTDRECTQAFTGIEAGAQSLVLYVGWMEFPGFLSNDLGHITGCTGGAETVLEGFLCIPTHESCVGIEKGAFAGVENSIYGNLHSSRYYLYRGWGIR